MALKLVVAGGSGFLGQRIVQWFDALGWDVVILTRRPTLKAGPGRYVEWDGKTLGDWSSHLEAAAAVLNLAGRSVNCRYHARNREAILTSRLEPTRILGEAIAKCARPPEVWLNSSTATIYKHSYDRPMDETGVIGGSPQAKDLFSVDVAKAWEQIFDEARTPATRKVVLRTAMVFGTQTGSVFRVLRRLARLGLGGAMAGGRQYVSWIHETDFCRAIQWLIDRQDFAGPVNLAAPAPVTNRVMMRTIRRACHASFGLPATGWMLEVGTFLVRSETELVIKSRRVIPARLMAAGFEFQFPDLTAAVADLERQLAGAVSSKAPSGRQAQTSALAE